MKARYESPWTRAERFECAATIALAILVCVALAIFYPGCIAVPGPVLHPPVQPAPAVWSWDVSTDPPVDCIFTVEGDPASPRPTDPTGFLFVNTLPKVLKTGALQAVCPGFDVFLEQEDWQTFDTTVHNVITLHASHYDPSGVPLEQLARIRGAMWTEQQPCPLGPRPGQPSNICATDFLWNYSDEWRERIVTNLTGLGYTHAVNGPLVDSDGYHGAWTPNDWRGKFDQFLDMLQFEWDHGLAPTVFITPDGWSLERAQAELTPLLQQPRAQKLIRIAVRAWEPCGYECSSYTWAAYGQWLRQALPNALILLHTVCDIDAPVGGDSRGDDNGHPNAEGWARVAPFYHGWLTQSCTFQNPDGHDDPPFSNFENWARLFNPIVSGSYQNRFQRGYAGWPRSSAWGTGQPLKVYAAEYASYPTFWSGWPKERARQWGDAAIAQGASGYLDGGSVPVGSGPVPWEVRR